MRQCRPPVVDSACQISATTALARTHSLSGAGECSAKMCSVIFLRPRKDVGHMCYDVVMKLTICWCASVCALDSVNRLSECTNCGNCHECPCGDFDCDCGHPCKAWPWKEGGLVIVVVVCGLDLECHRETEDRDCLVGVGSKSERNPLTRPENVDGRREF